MTGNNLSTSGTFAEGWDEIEEFLAEISQLTQSAVSLSGFAAGVVSHTSDYLRATGCAFCVCDVHGDWSSLQQVGLTKEVQLASLLSSAVSSGGVESRAFDSDGNRPSSQPNEIGTSLAFASPFGNGRSVSGALLLIQPNSLGEDERRGTERLLEMICELVGDYFRRQEVGSLQQQTHDLKRYESLSRIIHSSLDLTATTYHVANEGRFFVGCDRVTVLVSERGALRVAAVSGVDRVDARSTLVARAERLAGAVALSRQWLRYRGVTEGLPPQIEQPLNEFVDEAVSQSVDVVPLLVDSESEQELLVAVMIFEQFEGDTLDQKEELIVWLSNLASPAIRNSLDYQSLPFLALSRSFRKAVRFGGFRKQFGVIAAIGIVVALLLLAFVKIPFNVVSEGEAWPEVRRNLFAPIDGEVVEVVSEHDDRVREGDVLMTLRNRALELEFQRLRGEYQASEKKLLAIASARIGTDRKPDRERFMGQLAAEEQELTQQLSSLEAQLDLIRKQRESLEIRSPINGHLLTWDAKDLLGDRPVQRGQLLMTVADLQGPWVIELQLPGRRVGHVLEARRADEGAIARPLPIKFALPGGVSQTFHGELKSVSQRTEVVGDGAPVARALASIPSEAITFLRPGTQVRAKVNCGRRSIGFVLFHGIYEKLRMWFF